MIESYLPGVPAVNIAGTTGWFIDKIYNFDSTVDQVKETMDTLQQNISLDKKNP